MGAVGRKPFFLAGLIALGIVCIGAAIVIVRGNRSSNGESFSKTWYLHTGELPLPKPCFRQPRTYKTGARGSDTLVVLDLDGDGHPDLASPDLDRNFVSVARNSGRGGFEQAGVFRTGKRPYVLAAGDLNGDLSPDLVTANVTSGTVSGPAQPRSRFVRAQNGLPRRPGPGLGRDRRHRRRRQRRPRRHEPGRPELQLGAPERGRRHVQARPLAIDPARGRSCRSQRRRQARSRFARRENCVDAPRSRRRTVRHRRAVPDRRRAYLGRGRRRQWRHGRRSRDRKQRDGAHGCWRHGVRAAQQGRRNVQAQARLHRRRISDVSRDRGRHRR